MRKHILVAGALSMLVLSVSAVSASAQATRPRAGTAGDAEARREWLKEHKDNAKAKWETLTPEQKAAFKTDLKAYQDERTTLMDQVKAGTLDKKSAAEQLKAWREAHKPTKP